MINWIPDQVGDDFMERRVYKVEGIILKRKNVGEADRIITIFTKEYGKLRATAKGIRKVTSRRAPHLEVFTHIRAVIHNGKTIDTLSEVDAIEMYSDLRRDLQRVSLAYYVLELTDSLLAEKQEHRDVFVLLLRALSGKINTRQFALELLWTLGFLPHGKIIVGKDLQLFIESITERKLRTPPFVRRLLDK